MAAVWKSIIIIFLLYTIAIDANRARRHRRQAVLNARQKSANLNSQANTFDNKPEARQRVLRPNRKFLNAQGQLQGNQGGMGPSNDGNLRQNQPNRQYYPYQGQYGQGFPSQNYRPGIGGFGNQYGIGSYPQYYGQQPYGSYYQQYPGYNIGNYYNRPGYPSAGNYYGGYFWNGVQKANINMFIVFLSSLMALFVCFIAI